MIATIESTERCHAVVVWVEGGDGKPEYIYCQKPAEATICGMALCRDHYDDFNADVG